jgi:hypothetical protein
MAFSTLCLVMARLTLLVEETGLVDIGGCNKCNINSSLLVAKGQELSPSLMIEAAVTNASSTRHS